MWVCHTPKVRSAVPIFFGELVEIKRSSLLETLMVRGVGAPLWVHAGQHFIVINLLDLPVCSWVHHWRYAEQHFSVVDLLDLPVCSSTEALTKHGSGGEAN
jgi:predicted DNA repair protein MutK